MDYPRSIEAEPVYFGGAIGPQARHTIGFVGANGGRFELLVTPDGLAFLRERIEAYLGRAAPAGDPVDPSENG